MANIEYRNLGRSGLVVSTIGLGCNNFGRAKTVTSSQEGTTAVVSAAIEVGVTLFDTADIYGAEPGLSERLLGQALAAKRDGVVLATKFGMDMAGANGPDWGVRGSRRYIRLAVEASLRRLQTDWIDLYQLHTPDPATPIDETLETLDALITEGKIRYIGHSNFAGWQIADAEHRATMGSHPAFISAQNEYSLLARGVEAEVLPAVAAYGLGFLPFFPLFNGLLTGKYTRTDRPAGTRLADIKPELLERAPWDRLELYQAFCDDRGVTMLDATFGWLLARPGVTSVIAGATSAHQIRQNADAASAWFCSPEDAAAINDIFPA